MQRSKNSQTVGKV